MLRIVILVNVWSPQAYVADKPIVALMGMCVPAVILIALASMGVTVMTDSFALEWKLVSKNNARAAAILVLVAPPIAMKFMTAAMRLWERAKEMGTALTVDSVVV